MAKSKEEILSWHTINRFDETDQGTFYSAMEEYAKQEAIAFAAYIKTNFSIRKGKYCHRGDFYHNDKHGYSTFEIYTQYINLKQKP